MPPMYKLADGFSTAGLINLDDIKSPQQWADIPDSYPEKDLIINFHDHYEFSPISWSFAKMSTADYLKFCQMFSVPFRDPKFSNHVWHDVLRRYDRAVKRGKTFVQTVKP